MATSINCGTPLPVAQTPSGAGASATPVTTERGPVSPRRIPFRAEKQDLGKKFSGTDGKDGRDGKRGKGKGVTNAATAALALSNTQTNTVRIADALQRLATQGTVKPSVDNGCAQHWSAGLAVVVSGGLGMPDVHGRPAAQHVKAAAGCNHAHVRVVTASDVHLSRKHTIEVLEQVLLSVKQDVANRPSPTDDTVSLYLHPVIMISKRAHTNISLSLRCHQGVNWPKHGLITVSLRRSVFSNCFLRQVQRKCRPRNLTEKPEVTRLYPDTRAVFESDEKRKRRRTRTLAAPSKGVSAAAEGLQP